MLAQAIASLSFGDSPNTPDAAPRLGEDHRNLDENNTAPPVAAPQPSAQAGAPRSELPPALQHRVPAAVARASPPADVAPRPPPATRDAAPAIDRSDRSLRSTAG